MHNILFPKLKSWGVECDVVKSKTTAYQYMTTPIIKSKHHPERIGKYRGFPLCGKCGIQRDCKSRVCERYYKQITEPYNVILGLASNEKDRVMGANARNQIALLDLLGVHEKQTFKICNNEGLLSPTYSFSDRGGCWFCHNQGVDQLRLLRKNYPDLWALLLKWDNDSPVTFKPDGHTVHDFDRRFQAEDDGIILPNDRKFRWSQIDGEVQIKFF